MDSCTSGRRRIGQRRRLSAGDGFTLIELLVVIAIIAVLMSILIPSIERAKIQAKKILCASTLRQHVYALSLYSIDHAGKIPLRQMSGWVWDLDFETVDMILESGATRATFYCPCNRQQKLHNDKYWDYHGGYRVTGYFWMIDFADGQHQQILGTGNKKWIRTLASKDAERCELVTDVVLSDESYRPPEYPYGNFAKNSGGMFSRYGLYDETSHMRSEAECEGGNIGFADCHVTWRPFKDMERRLSMYPTHWW